MTELKRKAREKAQRLVAGQQEESVRFLIYVRDNPNADLRERVRCALELLNRGEMPAKSANYHGVGSASDLDEMFSLPKLVVLGKYDTKDKAPAPSEGGDDDEAEGRT